jgi:hypothetical protein
MDWSKVKTAIATIAPWLAGSFGTPAAGVAVGALCQVFGLTQATATPDNVLSAVTEASAEQVIALRDADLKHKEFCMQLGYNSLELLYKDVDSARVREETVKDRTPAILAGLAVGGFVALIVYTASGQTPATPMHDTFMMLAGASVALAKDVYGYYFGSSSGSKDKDATIQGLSK